MIIVAAALIIIGCFDENGIRKSKKIALLGIVPLAMFVISLCIVYVPSNNVGIRWSAFGGTSNKTLNEGIAIKSPIDKVFSDSYNCRRENDQESKCPDERRSICNI